MYKCVEEKKIDRKEKQNVMYNQKRLTQSPLWILKEETLANPLWTPVERTIWCMNQVSPPEA